jgi:hypothetical protein
MRSNNLVGTGGRTRCRGRGQGMPATRRRQGDGAAGWTLRIALTQAAHGTTGGTTVKDVRPLRCRLNLWHTWRPYDSMADDYRYMSCVRCGKDKYR